MKNRRIRESESENEIEEDEAEGLPLSPAKSRSFMIHLPRARAERASERNDENWRQNNGEKGSFGGKRREAGELFYVVGCIITTEWIVPRVR